MKITNKITLLFAFILLSVSSIAQTFSTEYVDLGLPSGNMWAKCNLGATKPEDFGYYFAWGETQQKPKYDWSTYKWCEHVSGIGGYTKQTKYCKDSSDGIVDNRTILELVDDAANYNLGGNWRIPTSEDIDELRTECTWTWLQINDINGYEVKGPNGNSIFLPAAGGYRRAEYMDENLKGIYWSSTLFEENEESKILILASEGVVLSHAMRMCGLTVRPIMNVKSTYNVSFENNGGEGIMPPITTEYGKVLVLPKNTFTRYESKFISWNTKPDGKGVRYEDAEKCSVGSNMTLYAQWYKLENNMPHKSVDLGLPSGIKWATCNVGASKPEELGYFFAWAETKPKVRYNWRTYTLKEKYEGGISYGSILKDKIILDIVDDAANVNWGGDWRMPTKEEYEELLTMCTWVWGMRNGVGGYLVTGPNGKSIFIPAIDDTSIFYEFYSYFHREEPHGYYWSSSHSFIEHDAHYLSFEPSNRHVGSYSYPVGMLIRPVMATYYVRFDGNGGEGYTKSLSSEYPRELRLPENNFTRSGYTFIGWNTKADGTGTSYLDRQSILVSSSLTLYAQWAEYVDLGLSSGTLWATCNVGANKPEEFGGEFAWGHTIPRAKYETSSWDTYKWCNGSENTMTKYCTLPQYGTIDNKTTLELADDAANFNWGRAWRMPTKEELEELRTECTWIWGTVNGVKGYTIKGQNGNTIFLPTTHHSWYWSSTLDLIEPNEAYALFIYPMSSYTTVSSPRMDQYNCHIRPVMDKYDNISE